MANADALIRLRAFEWLAEQTAVRGAVLPRTLLAQGFMLGDQRIPLLGPQGIFRPRTATYPISITTVPNSPYQDTFSADGLLAYKYRGSDPRHHENVGLREAGSKGIPLAYFHGIVPGRYLAVWPVYVVGADPASLTFTVAVDDIATAAETVEGMLTGDFAMPRRAYITGMVRRRLHQTSFRELVLRAYREQCALCRLRHSELLDAAHIIEDAHPDGVPSVRNGIALCKLHHAAFDAMMVGITPDYRIELRQDLLHEPDGPMLEHGLKGLHRTMLVLPKNQKAWPDPSALEHRYAVFRRAS
jgi:putative restriction endonuclease